MWAENQATHHQRQAAPLSRLRSIAISDMKEEDRPEWYDQAHLRLAYI